MNDELDKLILFMATLGWVYGKYDDRCFHVFDNSGSNTMTIKQAELLQAHTDKAVKEARIDEVERWHNYWNNGKDTRNTETYKSDRIKELQEE